MYNQNPHPQVVYSLETLTDALFSLMQHFPIEDISITMLCEKAYITRKTFYRNCESKQDLVDYRADQLINHLLSSVDWSLTDPVPLYRGFFSYWKQQREFLSIIYRRGLFSHFSYHFTELCVQYSNYHFLNDFLVGKPHPSELKLYHNAFLIGGLCSVLGYWVKEDFATSIDDLVITVSALAPEYGPKS